MVNKNEGVTSELYRQCTFREAALLERKERGVIRGFGQVLFKEGM